jgi:transposase InsO family protein
MPDQFGMQAFTSRKGNCFDDASIESFWVRLKDALTHRQHHETHAQGRAAIEEYIAIF